MLNNLNIGDVLYTTNRNTQYLFIGRDQDLGVIYSITNNRKTLPFDTINAAIIANNNGENINRQWYRDYNQHEYSTRPCNFSILKALLNRML